MVLADLGADVMCGSAPPRVADDAVRRPHYCCTVGDRRPGRSKRSRRRCWSWPPRPVVTAGLFPARHLRAPRHRTRLCVSQSLTIFARIYRLGTGWPLASTARVTTSTTCRGLVRWRRWLRRPAPMPHKPGCRPAAARCWVCCWALWWPSTNQERSGVGQVVDAAMVDGIAVGADDVDHEEVGSLRDQRSLSCSNGGAPFYRFCYETSAAEVHGRWGNRAAVLRGVAERDSACRPLTCRLQLDVMTPQMYDIFARAICQPEPRRVGAGFAGTDACVTPVLAWASRQQRCHLKRHDRR